VKLALHAFRHHNLANHIQVARDGVEALDFLFGTGRSLAGTSTSAPRSSFST